MSARKKVALKYIVIYSILGPGMCAAPLIALSADHSATPSPHATSTLARQTIAQQLGWVVDPVTFCGGYYMEEPLAYSLPVEKNNTVAITSGGGLLSQRSTSMLEGKV